MHAYKKAPLRLRNAAFKAGREQPPLNGAACCHMLTQTSVRVCASPQRATPCASASMHAWHHQARAHACMSVHVRTYVWLQVAHSLWSVMAYGGMRYIATGRGFSIQTTDFVKMYSMYARTHLYLGFELLFMVITIYVVNVSTRRLDEQLLPCAVAAVCRPVRTRMHVCMHACCCTVPAAVCACLI